jgi:hypothetical protein
VKNSDVTAAVDKRLHYTLRFASAMCFVGHGFFGIITKQIWLNYFALFGIGGELAYHLMPILGTLDVLMGISLLFYPTRAILLWLFLWSIITALARPLSGEPLCEALERAGNYGVPLTLLILSGPSGRNIKDWFNMIVPDSFIRAKTLLTSAACLRVVVFLLLAGHGWLNLTGKQSLLSQYGTLGFSNPAMAAHIAGIVDLLGAIFILLHPSRPVLLLLLFWKMGTELFYPHWEVFEWVERGGSYGAILALWMILPRPSIRIRGVSLE